MTISGDEARRERTKQLIPLLEAILKEAERFGEIRNEAPTVVDALNLAIELDPAWVRRKSSTTDCEIVDCDPPIQLSEQDRQFSNALRRFYEPKHRPEHVPGILVRFESRLPGAEAGIYALDDPKRFQGARIPVSAEESAELRDEIAWLRRAAELTSDSEQSEDNDAWEPYWPAGQIERAFGIPSNRLRQAARSKHDPLRYQGEDRDRKYSVPHCFQKWHGEILKHDPQAKVPDPANR